MKVKLDKDKIYLAPTLEERKMYIPLLATARLDRATGMFVLPTQGMLPLITIVPRGLLFPVDEATDKIVKQSYALLQMLSKYKEAITDGVSDIKSKEFPFLMKHQAVCNKLSMVRNRYAFFLDTGTR